MSDLLEEQLEQWAGRFPWSLDVRRCSECGGVMETELIHDKHTREDDRGVEAWKCADCGRAEYKGN